MQEESLFRGGELISDDYISCEVSTMFRVQSTLDWRFFVLRVCEPC